MRPLDHPELMQQDGNDVKGKGGDCKGGKAKGVDQALLVQVARRQADLEALIRCARSTLSVCIAVNVKKDDTLGGKGKGKAFWDE